MGVVKLPPSAAQHLYATQLGLQAGLRLTFGSCSYRDGKLLEVRKNNRNMGFNQSWDQERERFHEAVCLDLLHLA
jgi:hypothetical protein